MKKNICIFILGLIVAGSIGVYATIMVGANEIIYKDGTVESALNDLYSEVGKTKICKFESNEYGQKGQIGSEYVCDVKLDGQTKYNFYILNITGDSVTLIMKHNITENSSQTRMSWSDALKYVQTLNWKIRASLPSAQDIANAVGYSTWDVTNVTSSNQFCLKSHVYDNVTGARCNNNAEYCWLHDYLYFDYEYHCAHLLSSTEAFGYWTSDYIFNDTDHTYAWRIHSSGSLSSMGILQDNYMGVRPVITVLKSNLYE